MPQIRPLADIVHFKYAPKWQNVAKQKFSVFITNATVQTSNLSKAHMTRDSGGPATWAIVYSMQLNNASWRSTHSRPPDGRLLEFRRSKLTLLKCMFYAKNFIHSLSRSISSHFGTIYSSNVCHSWKLKKSSKFLILEVQDRSRSSMLTPLNISSPVVVTISSMSVSICNCFHARRANKGRITTF